MEGVKDGLKYRGLQRWLKSRFLTFENQCICQYCKFMKLMSFCCLTNIYWTNSKMTNIILDKQQNDTIYNYAVYLRHSTKHDV